MRCDHESRQCDNDDDDVAAIRVHVEPSVSVARSGSRKETTSMVRTYCWSRKRLTLMVACAAGKPFQSSCIEKVLLSCSRINKGRCESVFVLFNLANYVKSIKGLLER